MDKTIKKHASDATANVTINHTTGKLCAGEKLSLSLLNTDKKIKWNSSDKKVATVNSKGKVTAKAAGTCIISAKVGKRTFSCALTVTK